MSSCFKPKKEIAVEDLFDGRLGIYGIHERPPIGDPRYRCLTDLENTITVVPNIKGKIWYLESLDALCYEQRSGNDPSCILKAISEIFETEIELISYNYDTNAWSIRSDQTIFADLFKFVRGERFDIRISGNRVVLCRIIKELAATTPDLNSIENLHAFWERVLQVEKQELRSRKRAVARRRRLLLHAPKPPKNGDEPNSKFTPDASEKGASHV